MPEQDQVLDLGGGVPLDMDADGASESRAFDTDATPGLDTIVTPGADGSVTVLSGLGTETTGVFVDQTGDGTIEHAYLTRDGVTYAVDPSTGTILGTVDPDNVSLPAPAAPTPQASIDIGIPSAITPSPDASAQIAMPESSITPSPDASAQIAMPESSITPSPDASAQIAMPESSITPSPDASAQIAMPESSIIGPPQVATIDVGIPHSFLSPSVQEGHQTVATDPTGPLALESVEGSAYPPPTLTNVLHVDSALIKQWHFNLESERIWRDVTGTDVPRNADGTPPDADYLLTTLRDVYITDPAAKATLTESIANFQQLRRQVI